MSYQTSCLRGLSTQWFHQEVKGKDILLFVHGFPDGSEVWSAQLEYFQTKYHLIAPNLRGCLEKDALADLDRFGLDSICLDLLQLIDEADPTAEKKVHIVGHDLGAAYSWALSALLGPRSASLTILNGLSVQQMARRLTRSGQALRSLYMPFFCIPVLSQKVLSRWGGSLSSLAYRLGSPGLAQEGIHPTAQATYFSGGMRRYPALLKDMVQQRASNKVMGTTKTLIIWGASDPFLNLPHRREFLDETEKPILRIMKAGHWIQREIPEKLNPILEEFFDASC